MSNPVNKIEKRSLIVVGKTGVGKSKFLNELMSNNYFKSSVNTQSCTNKVECSEWNLVKFKFEFNNKTQEMPYQLMSFDTPGIGDSRGRSKQFLNEIAQTIKTTPLNLLIILVEYGRLDVGFYNNLEILCECLNELSQSSTMLVVNKVPTKKNLERKRKQGEEVKDREDMLKEIFEKLSECLGSEFKYKLYLENDDMDDAEIFNAEQYNIIRQIIFTCSSHLNSSKVKTWQEIVEFYTKSIENDQMLNVQLNELKALLENQLEKTEFDIADNIYHFLASDNDKNYDEKEVEFVKNFECKITRERYQLLTGFIIDGSLLESYSDVSDKIGFSSVNLPGFLRKTETISFLKIAGERLSSLRKEFEKWNSSIEEREKMLKLRKEKITRLENSLANPNQFN